MSYDPLDRAKFNKVYDLICRACANGRQKEVAEAIAADWNPPIEIDKTGMAFFPTLDRVTVRTDR